MTTRPGKRISTRPIDAPDTLVGRVLDGRYRLESVISVGGMGIIFAGYQLATDRRVAIKVLRPTLANDVDLHARFRLEIETLSRLDHPNIVTLHDCGQDASGLHYLVMEHLDGRTFRERLRDCELSIVEILDVFAQTCHALVEAHRHDVIHRDLKFDNIMVRRFGDGRVHATVLDFGVAKLLSRDESITRSGEVPGTPDIIAPELADGLAPSAQSDLYSLGILLFTAITGQTPFSGDNEFELMRAHRTEDLPRIEPLVGNRVPESLVDVVYELTQKEPRLRPRSASEVRDRLENVAAEIRRRHTDLPRYRPPSGAALDIAPGDEDPLSQRSLEFLAERHEMGREGETKRTTSTEPILVPASLVSLLIFLVLILVLVILYFGFQTYVLKSS